MAVDVIEAAKPSLQTTLFHLHHPAAETAPEPHLVIAPIEAVLEALLHVGGVGDAVIVLQVRPELLAAVEDAGAASGRGTISGKIAFLSAFPQLELIVLAVFVPLPVVLAAEALVALWKRAAVGFGVALLVLPGEIHPSVDDLD